MAEFIKPKHGEICWRELTTNDSGKAKNFYAELFGWKFENSKISPIEYPEIYINERPSGGIMQMTEEWGDPLPPSHWMNYIAVEDINESVSKIKDLGGNVCIPPFEAPNVGIISVVGDPRGAIFSIIQFTGN